MLGDFEYVRARTIRDACELLKDGGGEAVAYAGGTDLLVEIRNGLRAPKLLVDIKEIESLRRIDLGDESSPIALGAAVPLNRIAEDESLRGRIAALTEAALTIATYQLRNRATIGGNLCNASPASDSIPPLLVAGAVLRIEGPDGGREVALRDFCTGVKRTCLECGEILVGIRIPPLATGTRTAFLKQQRIRGHDLAVVNVAGALSPSDGTLRIAIGSCGPTPILLDPIKTGADTAEAITKEAVRDAQAAASPISDVRASAEYRRAVLPVLVCRMIARLLDETGGV